jgi:hypothetical protein
VVIPLSVPLASILAVQLPKCLASVLPTQVRGLNNTKRPRRRALQRYIKKAHISFVHSCIGYFGSLWVFPDRSRSRGIPILIFCITHDLAQTHPRTTHRHTQQHRQQRQNPSAHAAPSNLSPSVSTLSSPLPRSALFDLSYLRPLVCWSPVSFASHSHSALPPPNFLHPGFSPIGPSLRASPQSTPLPLLRDPHVAFDSHSRSRIKTRQRQSLSSTNGSS